MKKKVVVGMSGGVDSSVASYILKNEGYEVIGVTLKMFEGEAFEKSVDDAEKVCRQIGIEHFVADMTASFEENVVKSFINEYLSGRTPNPCVICNQSVKWDGLLRAADKAGAQYVATGHYAEIVDFCGRLSVKTAESAARDQSYMLYRLNQEQLEKTMFPCGRLSKAEVRRIAAKAGLEVAEKADSQEICFVPDDDYMGFLISRGAGNGGEGNFVDIEGRPLGRHKGIANYTVGQRKGLEIAFGRRVYVKSINSGTKDIVLCDDENIFENKVLVNSLNFMGLSNISGKIRTKGKIRYSQKASDCSLEMTKDGMVCVFDEKQRAVTPGQSAVFYQDECVVCGGIIQ